MAQRLVRRLCPDCSEPVDVARGDAPADFPWEKMKDHGKTVYRAVGCPKCRGNGYLGRVGVYELLTGNEEIRDLATKRSPSNLVKNAAVRAGMITLREDGWHKVLEGTTTIDEVLRVTKE